MMQAQLLFYFFFISLNIILNLYFFFGPRKHEIYKWSTIFWVAALSFYLLEGALENTKFIGFSLIMASVTNFAVLKICSLLMEIEYKRYKDLYVSGVVIFLGTLVSNFSVFEVYTSFFSLAATYPYFSFILRNRKEMIKNNGLEKVMLFTYSLNVIHILDYPFLRLNKEFASTGFNIAFFFGIILSIFIYITSDSIYVKSIEKKLKNAIEEKNKIYNRLIATKLIKSFSHELNTALQNIICSQEILEGKTNEIKDQDLFDINSSITYSVKKIQNILHPFCKSEESAKEEISIDNILLDSKSLLEVYSNKKNIFLKNNEKNKSVILNIQKGILIQIIVNIVSSILKNNSKLEMEFSNNSIVFNFNENKNLELDFPIILSSQIGLKVEKENNKIILDLSNSIIEQNTRRTA